MLALERLNQLDLGLRMGRQNVGEVVNPVSDTEIVIRIFKGRVFQDALAGGSPDLWNTIYWQDATVSQDTEDPFSFTTSLAQSSLDLQELINMEWFDSGEGFEQPADTLTWAVIVDKTNSNDKLLMVDSVRVDAVVDELLPPVFYDNSLTFRVHLKGGRA